MESEKQHVCPNCKSSNVNWVGNKLVCFDCNTTFDEDDE